MNKSLSKKTPKEPVMSMLKCVAHCRLALNSEGTVDVGGYGHDWEQ